MIRKRTRNQLTSTPMRIPKTRASCMDPPPNTTMDGGRCRELCPQQHAGERDARVDVELPVYAFHVLAHRVGAERQLLRDLAVAEAVGHPQRHLALARGQRHQGLLRDLASLAFELQDGDDRCLVLPGEAGMAVKARSPAPNELDLQAAREPGPIAGTREQAVELD